MSDSLAILKNQKCIIECKCDILDVFWFYIKAINVYLRKILLHRYFSGLFLDVQETIWELLSMVVSKIAYLIYQTFCLGLLRSFAVNLYPCARDGIHSRDVLLSDILLSVLIFFSFIWFCHFYSPKYKLFLLLLYFMKFTIHFVFKICGMFLSNFWLVKNTCSIIFGEKMTYD